MRAYIRFRAIGRNGRVAARDDSVVDGLGTFWAPDDYFVGGVHSRYVSTVFSTSPNSEVFTTERVGDFEYFFAVPPGRYSATIYFAEGWFGRNAAGRGGPGSRVFDVFINHEMALPNFDMLREGRANQLITKTFRHLQPDLNGQLRFTFTPRVNYASFRGVEISQDP